MQNEFARVRLWSRIAAGALGALAALAVFAFAPALHEGASAPGAAIVQAVNVALERPDAPVQTPQREALAVASEADGAQADDVGLELRLWRYGADGEILFRTADQYARCAEARRSGREASDCPSSRETAELRFAANETLR